jgi:LPS-assembly lipoprotein
MHNPQDAEVVITVDHEAFTRQVLSVDPTTGKAREFALTYTAQFSAQGGNGAFLVEPQLVQISRDFIFEETAVIGKSREEDLLRIEMQRDAAQQILRRLAKVEK